MDKIGEDGSLTLDEVRTMQQVWQGFTHFSNEDVIVAKITPCFENGKGALCDNLISESGFGTTELYVLRVRKKIGNPKFIFYVTHSDLFRNVGAARMQGVAGQQRVPTDFVINYSLSCPPLQKQHTIASFLDHEILRIGALISKLARLLRS